MLKPHEREWNAERNLKKFLDSPFTEQEWLDSVEAIAEGDGVPKTRVIESLGFSVSDAIDMVALYRGEV